MPDNRSVFERLDNIEAQNAEIIRLLSTPSVQPRLVQQAPVKQPTNQELYERFIKEAKKSWMWFGNTASFRKTKMLAIIALVTLLVVGLAETIFTTISFGMYSTFTAFENVWMIFGIIYLVYVIKAQRIYEVNEFAANYSYSTIKDKMDMIFFRKEKTVFRVFRWFAFISVIANIICIWIRPSSFAVLATIVELLFLGAIIFVFWTYIGLFAQYTIIYVEGQNQTTKERVVLVLPQGAKHLITEEEFKKKMWFLYE